jgi:16S rRNA (adenine1518-N6/adenine1519-N6)-dimethyltransferase
VRPRKRFGQHFLESAWIRKVVDLVDAQPGERIVEIGPGRGALTRPLAARAGQLLAIEVDRDLAASLMKDAPPNLHVVTADVLKVDLASTLEAWLGAPPGPSMPVRIVGNLPYNISSPILFRLLGLASATHGVGDAILMLQREVAERLLARPGGKEYGVLRVLTELHADVSRLLNLPAGAFRPVPKVLSTVVRLRFRPSPVEVASPALFTEMVRSTFTQRRKTLANALATFASSHGLPAAEALHQAGIDPRRRPETLDLRELARLAAVFGQKPREGVL